MKIGVFVDEDCKVESFTKGRYLAVFEKDKKSWVMIKNIELMDCSTFGLVEMRRYFNSVADAISEVKVVVSKETYGIPYNVFYSRDFSIWDIEGDPYNFLEKIMIKEIENERKDKEEVKQEPIIKVAEGKYFIDLIELQKLNGITSKQAMIPFLQGKRFDTLEVKCCHIPPWLNKERSRLGFSMEILQQERDLYKVILSNIN